jgi:hypothetical protein
MPNPSFWPLVTALGLMVMMSGLIFGWWLGIPGFLMFIVGAFAWCFEPAS